MIIRVLTMDLRLCHKIKLSNPSTCKLEVSSLLSLLGIGISICIRYCFSSKNILIKKVITIANNNNSTSFLYKCSLYKIESIFWCGAIF